MVVKFGMKDSVFARKIEPFIHVTVLLFALTTSSIGLAMGLYGEISVGVGCWLRPTETCDGDCIHKFEGIFVGVPFILCISMVALNNTLIFCHVRDTIYDNIKKTRERFAENLNNLRESLNVSNRMSFSLHSSGAMSMREAMDRASERAARKEEKIRRKEAKRAARKARKEAQKRAKENIMKQASVTPEQKTRIKRVGIQSLLYCVVFAITYAWTTVLISYRNRIDGGGSPEVEPTLYPFMVLRAFFIPLMGLWNLLVYVRPRYCTLRDQEIAKEHGESRFTSLRRVIWDVDAGLVGRKKLRKNRFASTKTQLGNASSARSKFGSTTSVQGSMTTLLGQGTSTRGAGGPLPPMILERGESQVSVLAGAPPSTILESGESQHTQIGTSRAFKRTSRMSRISKDFSGSLSNSKDFSGSLSNSKDFSFKEESTELSLMASGELSTTFTPAPKLTTIISEPSLMASGNLSTTFTPAPPPTTITRLMASGEVSTTFTPAPPPTTITSDPSSMASEELSTTFTPAPPLTTITTTRADEDFNQESVITGVTHRDDSLSQDTLSEEN